MVAQLVILKPNTRLPFCTLGSGALAVLVSVPDCQDTPKFIPEHAILTHLARHLRTFDPAKCAPVMTPVFVMGGLFRRW